MSERSVDDDSLRGALQDFTGRLLVDSYERATAGDLYKRLIEDVESLSSPESYFYAHEWPRQQQVCAALQDVKGLASDVKNRYTQAFLNFRIFERHIRQLTQQFEGHTFCQDKASWVVTRYLRQLRGLEVGNWCVGKDRPYWQPGFGTHEQWMCLMEGLGDFLYGRAEQYLSAHAAIVEAGESINSKVK